MRTLQSSSSAQRTSAPLQFISGHNIQTKEQTERRKKINMEKEENWNGPSQHSLRWTRFFTKYNLLLPLAVTMPSLFLYYSTHSLPQSAQAYGVMKMLYTCTVGCNLYVVCNHLWILAWLGLSICRSCSVSQRALFFFLFSYHSVKIWTRSVRYYPWVVYMPRVSACILLVQLRDREKKMSKWARETGRLQVSEMWR